MPAFLTVAVSGYAPFYIKPLLKLTGTLAPSLAARIMGELVSRPRGRNPTQPWELTGGVAGREVELRPGLFALTWGESGPIVLGLHGWRGRPTQFRPLANALLAHGFRTIAIDAPGHGRSQGEHATPRQFGELLIDVEKLVGPTHTAIGHSFGGAAIGAALALGYRPGRIVLASSPTHVSRMPFAIAKMAGLPARAMPAFARLLEKNAGRPIQEFDLVTTGPRCGIPGFLLHDRADHVIPFSEAEALIAAWPGLRVMATESVLHRDILGVPEVVQAITGFIS